MADRDPSSDGKYSMRSTLLRQLRHQTSVPQEELQLFSWFVSETEALIEQMKKEEAEFVQELVNLGDSEPNTSGFLTVEYFIKRSRYSHIIYLTSVMESALESECARLPQVLGKVPFELNELKGDKWPARKKFLERYGQFVIPANIWSPLHSLILVRNFLVHDNGSISEIQDGDRNFLQKQPGLDLTGTEIIVSLDFVLSSLESAKALLSYIHEEISKIVGRAMRPEIVNQKRP